MFSFLINLYSSIFSNYYLLILSHHQLKVKICDRINERDVRNTEYDDEEDSYRRGEDRTFIVVVVDR